MSIEERMEIDGRSVYVGNVLFSTLAQFEPVLFLLLELNLHDQYLGGGGGWVVNSRTFSRLSEFRHSFGIRLPDSTYLLLSLKNRVYYYVEANNIQKIS